VLRSRFLLSLLIALFLSTLASADSVPVNMTFLHPGTHVSGGYYTDPYHFSINGGNATAMMWDAFNSRISPGENRNATVSGLLDGKGMFGKNLLDYKAAGIMFMGVIVGTIKATTGNGAVWNLFTKGVTQNSATLALDSEALLLARHAPASEFKGLVLCTPEGGSPGHGPREFIGYRSSAMATPEPGRLMLLATGLMGIAGVARRKLRV